MGEAINEKPEKSNGSSVEQNLMGLVVLSDIVVLGIIKATKTGINAGQKLGRFYVSLANNGLTDYKRAQFIHTLDRGEKLTIDRRRFEFVINDDSEGAESVSRTVLNSVSRKPCKITLNNNEGGPDTLDIVDEGTTNGVIVITKPYMLTAESSDDVNLPPIEDLIPNGKVIEYIMDAEAAEAAQMADRASQLGGVALNRD